MNTFQCGCSGSGHEGADSSEDDTKNEKVEKVENIEHQERCESCRVLDVAVEEIRKLREQVEYLIPFATADAELGASLQSLAAAHGCDPLCEDCKWYEDSVAFLARVQSGEFDPAPETLHAAAVKAFQKGRIAGLRTEQ